MNEKLLIESMGVALQALALSKAIRDILMTDEQRKKIPDLYLKYAREEANRICDVLGIESEKIYQSVKSADLV